MRSCWKTVACISATALVVACSAGSSDSLFNQGSHSNGTAGQGGGEAGKGGADAGTQLQEGGIAVDANLGEINPQSDCAEAAKLIYLVSVQKGLHSFDPTVDGRAAYRFIGNLNCPSSAEPQSMSVDRSGRAWVFYNDGQMFHVSTEDASCSPTAYRHPVNNAHNQLGMGFTATVPDSSEQVLYVISPDFGLATVDTETLAVGFKNVLVGTAAELTGGPDAKLFTFDADTTTLSELDASTFARTALHRFNDLQGTVAWAFGRYAGKFYMFTATDTMWGDILYSRTTIYDPVTGQSQMRDADIGFTVVGAGQSTCVPPPPPK